MIIPNQKIEVIISNNAKYYVPFGYTNLKQGNVILVDIEHLPKNSNKLVKCSCDTCKELFERQYQLVNNKELVLCYQCSRKEVGVKNSIIQTKIKPQYTNIPKNDDELKLWIKTNGFRKDGRMTSHATKKEWFVHISDVSIYNMIIIRTSYLDSSIGLLQRYYDILNDIAKLQLCKCCDNPAIFFKTLNYGYSKYCSTKCVSLDSEHQQLRQKKYEKAVMEKYGVTNVSYIPEVQKKISKAISGRKMPIPSSGIWPNQQHFTEQHLYYINNLDEVYNMHVEQEIPITTLSKQLGFSPPYLHQKLTKTGYKIKIFSGSYQQKQLYEWIKETITPNILYNDRSFLDDNLELDILFINHRLAIEINGLYWHGEANPNIKDLRNNMVNKTKLTEAKNIRLLHFYDVEIIEKFETVKSIILSALGLIETKYHARKCELLKIEPKTTLEFFKENHIQTPIYSKYNYGLFYNSELVAAMGISKSRSDNKNYEIIRFANKINTNVAGGFDKLLSHAIKELSITDNLISFVDRRLFTGRSYKNRFELQHISQPNFYYYKRHSVEYKLESRIKFQKFKLKGLYDKGILTFYDETLSASKIMRENDYYRVYDCGHYLFKLKPL